MRIITYGISTFHDQRLHSDTISGLFTTNNFVGVGPPMQAPDCLLLCSFSAPRRRSR
jgi:hypothetical protein